MQTIMVLFADGHWRYGALWFQMFKLFFSVPRALARKSRLARTLSFTQVSEIAQVCWGECRHALRYTTFKVKSGCWADLGGGGCFDGFNISQFPSNCRAGVLCLGSFKVRLFSCWLWMLTQQWPVSFHYYSLVFVVVLVGEPVINILVLLLREIDMSVIVW